MRPSYRDIGRAASMIMFTGAGKSQGNGGTVVKDSFLKLQVKVKINGIEYTSEQSAVSSAFLSSVIALTNVVGYSPSLSELLVGNTNSIAAFSLLSSDFDGRLDVAFDSLSNLSISSFKTIGGGLLETTIKGTGKIQIDGIIKSAGFGVTTNESNAVNPNLNIPKRQFSLPVPTGHPFIPSNKWVYDPYNKKLLAIGRLYYGSYTATVYVKDYDIRTGVLGETYKEIQGISTESYDCITGDGVNFLLSLSKFSENSKAAATSFDYFDFKTLTASRIFLTHPVPVDKGAYWDIDEKVIRSRRFLDATYYDYNTNTTVTRLFKGYTIDLNGIVTLDTGASYAYPSTALMGTKSIIFTPSGSLYSSNPNAEKGTSIAGCNLDLDRRDYLADLNGDILTVEFDDIDKPTKMTFRGFRLPDTASSICRLPSIEARKDQEYEVTATITMTDRSD